MRSKEINEIHILYMGICQYVYLVMQANLLLWLQGTQRIKADPVEYTAEEFYSCPLPNTAKWKFFTCVVNGAFHSTGLADACKSIAHP